MPKAKQDDNSYFCILNFPFSFLYFQLNKGKWVPVAKTTAIQTASFYILRGKRKTEQPWEKEYEAELAVCDTENGRTQRQYESFDFWSAIILGRSESSLSKFTELLMKVFETAWNVLRSCNSVQTMYYGEESRALTVHFPSRVVRAIPERVGFTSNAVSVSG